MVKRQRSKKNGDDEPRKHISRGFGMFVAFPRHGETQEHGRHHDQSNRNQDNEKGQAASFFGSGSD